MAASARRRRAVVAAVVAVQLVVPAAVLVAAEPPVWFGWQMFAAEVPTLSAAVVVDGAEQDVDVGTVLARQRPEVDWTTVLPDHLCARFPAATAAVVRRGTQEAVRSCR